MNARIAMLSAALHNYCVDHRDIIVHNLITGNEYDDIRVSLADHKVHATATNVINSGGSSTLPRTAMRYLVIDNAHASGRGRPPLY